MKLARLEGAGRPQNAYDVFVALDDNGRRIGKCSVVSYKADSLLPDCPYNIYLDLDGRLECMDMLLGAAVASAYELHRQYPRLDARVYTGCAPDDTQLIRILREYGFNVDDGEEGMIKRLRPDPMRIELPAGMSWISDALESREESAQTLRRINSTFAETRDEAWLDRLKLQSGFRRYAVVDMENVVGEILLYRMEREGVVAMLIVDPPARHRGVAQFLLECARVHFLSMGLSYARADVWARLQPARRLFEKEGFEYKQDTWFFPGFTMYREANRQ